MMFTSTNDLEDSVFSMDHYSFPSPWNYFEFDGSVLHWNNTCTSSETNGIVLEQEKASRVSRRGPSKGDRHSKIVTANGLRDRRMRLSLDVAREFFKLQDLLSFDKPSKTMKWLLSKARSAIEELDKGEKSPCVADNAKVAAKAKKKEKSKKKRNIDDQFRPIAKQMRKEARERARERTIKKKQALSDFGNYIRPCSSDVVHEIEQQIQDEMTKISSSVTDLSYPHQDDFCKANPNSESQQLVDPNLGQVWFY